MVRKALNIVMVALFSGMLLCVLVPTALKGIGARLAGENPQEPVKTALEGRTYTQAPTFSLSSFQSGAYQDQCEDFLADNLPDREDALILNASLQYAVIDLASLPLGYQILPTHFDSDVVYDKQDGVLADMPLEFTEERLDKIKAFGAGLESLSSHFPDTRFFVMTPARASFAEDSPLTALVPNAIGQDDLKEALSGQLDNATLIDFPSDYDTRLAWFFATDHHWNMDGAYEGYKAIANALGHGDELVAKGGLVYESPAFYGAYARDGLFDKKSEIVYDYEFDLPLYDVTINGKEKSMKSLVHEKDGKEDMRFSSRYSNRFHHEYKEIELTNPEVTDGSKLLIVGDSFTDCIERLLAAHYETTVVFDPRETAGNDGTTVAQMIEQHGGFDDVVFLFNSTALSRDDVIAALQ